MRDCKSKYCVIGAGAAGLAAAKNLAEQGIAFDCFEREDDVGGNWYFGKPNSSIYASVHTISSKSFTAYSDYPLPQNFPTYINRVQAHEYLKSYARHFGLYPRIRFACAVEHVAPVEDGKFWDVTLSDGEVRRYRGVVVCNGHLWDPRVPDYPGEFSGEVYHSSEYKTPDVLTGKRVLVVGAGNSGCDIAVEASHHATATFHSTRRGYYYWPKFLFGMPADVWAEIPLQLRIPLFLRRLFGGWVLRWFSNGRPEAYGLAPPDHRMFEAHFIINSQLTYHLAHGDLTAKGDIERLCGKTVKFKDGSEEPIDVIVYATGFNIKFPFIDAAHLDCIDGCPDLYAHAFHRRYDNAFVIGMFQASTGNWPLMDYQSQVMARFIASEALAPSRYRWFAQLKAQARPHFSGGIRFARTSRHLLECDQFVYRRLLKKLARKLALPTPRPSLAGASAHASLAGRTSEE